MRRKGQRYRQRRREPIPLASLVGAVVRAAPEGTARPVTELVWRRAVGVDVAKRTRPFRLEKGVLWVKVGSSAWAQELSLLKETLVSRLSAQGIAVSDVRFRVGAVEPLTRPPGSRVTIRERPKGAPLPDELAAAIAQLDDPELRDALAAAAAQNLAWQAATSATSAPLASPALRSSGAGSGPSGQGLKPAPAAPRRTPGAG